MSRVSYYRPKDRREKLGPLTPEDEAIMRNGGDPEATKAFPNLAAHGTVVRRGHGLGDVVATFATPIARALRLPCIDPQTKQLRPESGCAKRQKEWNRIRLP